MPDSAIALQLTKDLKISRTYCLSSEPSRLRSTPCIYDHVFSHKPVAIDVDYAVCGVETTESWRFGFWGKCRDAWDTRPKPLQPWEETTLSRRYLAQKDLLPDVGEHLRRRERRVRRNQKARSEALQKMQSSESSDSSSESSSSSDS